MGLRELLRTRQKLRISLIIVGWGVLSLLHVSLKILYRLKSVLWSKIWHHFFDYRKLSRTVDTGWCVANIVGSARVPIDLLRARIRTPKGIQIRCIEDTPHYEWIHCLVEGREQPGSAEKYKEYIQTYEPDWDVEKRLGEVRCLVTAMKEGLTQDPLNLEHAIVVFPPDFAIKVDITFQIMDGVHRAAIWKAAGISAMAVLVNKSN